MFTIAKGLRLWVAVGALAFLAGPVSANAPPDQTPRTTATQRTHNTGRDSGGSPTDEQPPPGSPEFGVLILIGIVAFLVAIAWVIARFGDNTRPPSDSVMS